MNLLRKRWKILLACPSTDSLKSLAVTGKPESYLGFSSISLKFITIAIAGACVQAFPQTTHKSRRWRSRCTKEHTHGPGAPVFHCPPGVREGRMAERLSPSCGGSQRRLGCFASTTVPGTLSLATAGDRDRLSAASGVADSFNGLLKSQNPCLVPRFAHDQLFCGAPAPCPAGAP